VAAAASLPTPPERPPATVRAVPRAGMLREHGAVRHDTVSVGRWRTSGTVKVTGDVVVDEADLRGLTTIGGKFTAERCSAHGTLEVLGATDVRSSATVDGMFRAVGPVHVGATELRGVLRAVAEIHAERELTVTGVLEAPSVRVGLLTLEGSATVPGAVTSRSVVRATFRADSNLGQVTAREVVLRGPAPGLVPQLVRKVFGGAADVHVERIEADRVALEAVEVGFVRAGDIRLGPGAQVTEYEGSIVHRHPTARVGPESRTPPPYGLSR
jgi:cytoskeletal protein CcmA (bactofilin family)